LSPSPKTLEALEIELMELLTEEQEYVLKTENRIVELKAEIQKLQGQLKTYKQTVSERKKPVNEKNSFAKVSFDAYTFKSSIKTCTFHGNFFRMRHLFRKSC